MDQRAQQIYSLVDECYARVYSLIGPSLQKELAELKSSSEHADWAYALKHTADKLKDLTTEVRKIIELNERIACLLWMNAPETALSGGRPIRTDHTTATPKLKMIASLPKHNTPEMKALCDFLGIPEEVFALDAFRPNFNGMADLITKRMEEGRPLPPGVSKEKTYPKYSLVCRATKPVDYVPDTSST